MDMVVSVWVAGVFNDLNILEVSNQFARVLCGEFPQTQPSYCVNGKIFDWFYYLTDGIYPNWKIFVKTLSEPASKRRSTSVNVRRESESA